MKTTILGAGTMASALTIPLSDRNHEIRLWGTKYDEDILKAIRSDEPHPRLNRTLPDRVQPFDPNELESALEGAELVLLGVSSKGVVPVLQKAAPCLRTDQILLSVAKGVPSTEEAGYLMKEGIETVLSEKGLDASPDLVFAGGPSIAAELAHRSWTPVMYAGAPIEAAQTCAEALETDYYDIHVSGDVRGTETCLGFKNIYAIALAWPTGLAKKNNTSSLSNMEAFLFMQALRELATLVEKRGGRQSTVYERPGLGDFVTTSESGRNGMFGQLLGQGFDPEEAERILKEEKNVGVIEGYETGKDALHIAKEIMENESFENQLPLLYELEQVLYQGAEVEEALNNVYRTGCR